MSQVVKKGKEKLFELKESLHSKNITNILLVSGKTSFKKSSAQDTLEPILKDFNVFRFHEFEENPKIEDVKKGVVFFLKNNCQAILAVGGGSVIDMAKLINAYHMADREISICIKDNLPIYKVVPFYAIPTTAGSGSEATHFAVVYVDEKKYSVASNKLLAEKVFLVPEFTYSATAYLTAVTGLDAFSQAIESWWSVNSNDKSISYSRQAIKLVWNNLVAATKHNCKDAKRKMMEASNFAGRAINITMTTAPHAVSYPFTTYFGVPHGHAVALTLVFFFNYNYCVTDVDCNDQRGSDFVRNSINEIIRLIGEENIKSSVSAILDFIDKLNLPDLFNELNITPLNIKEKIIANINLERVENNPRKVNVDALYNFLITAKHDS